jgi:hypothetical protein
MAITYPLALPTQAGIANVALRAANVVALSQSPFTYRQQVFKHPGERWEATVSLPAMARANAETWVSFLLALKGQSGTFLLGDPANATARGGIAGSSATVQVRSNVSIGATAIPLKGLPNSVTGVFAAGDYIQLGAAATATLHKVLLPANSNGSGETTLEVWPAVRRAVVADEAVVYTDPVGRFRLSSNAQDWQINTARIYDIRFEAVEAVI